MQAWGLRVMDNGRAGKKQSRHRRTAEGSPDLGLRIRKLRVERGLSQEILAHRVGRSPGWMLMVENGKADPVHSDLVNIANVLNVTIVQLLETGTHDSRLHPISHLVELHTARHAFPGDRDGQLLDGMATLTRSYLHLHNTVSPWAVHAAIVRHFDDLTTLALRSYSSTTSGRILSMAAQAAILAGWVSFNVQDFTEAYVYWCVAHDLARDAGNAAVQAHALGSRSRLYSPIHRDLLQADPGTALALLDQAVKLASGVASPVLRSWLLANRAQQLAVSDQAAASYRDLEASAHQLSLAEQTDNDLLAGWDEVRVDAYRGICAMVLGQPSEVIAITESVLERTTDNQVQRCLQQSDLAAAHAQRGDVDQASLLLSEALTRARRSQFPEGVQRVRRTRAQYLQGANSPSVSQLDALLAATC
jgi:transcriptional regulator with XRE-family HTH domain